MSYSYDCFEEIKRGGFEFTLPLTVIEILKQLHKPFNINTELVKQISFEPVISGTESSLPNSQLNNKNMLMRSMNDIGKNSNNKYHSLYGGGGGGGGPKSEPDNYIQTIRLLLNKISDKTYMDCVTKIINIIEKRNPDEMPALYINMFEVILHNSFYSKLYADVYSLCITTNKLFLDDGFIGQYNKYIESFNDIVYVDPNTDYDNYCVNNSKNEVRKSFGKFMLNLNKNNIIDTLYIHNTLDILILKIKELIILENNTSIVDEMVENIFIIYDKNTIINNKYKSIMIEFSKYKSKQFPSLSNKSIFKIMDLI
jgi:hypothetical protein